MDFKDRHRVITNKPIFPNDCLAWLELSIDDREKVLEDNELECRRCLRGLRQNVKGNACGKGNHTFNNGKNGMCVDKSCDRHSTICKSHEELNKNRHQILRRGLEWANRVRPQTPGRNTDNMSFVMIVDEEVESNSEKELDEMNSVRKEIQIKTNQDPLPFFEKMDTQEHTALVVVEDRRDNEAQFDLAYTNIDNEEILTAFDSCSNTTLIHKDLVNEGKIQVLKTGP